MSDIIRNKGIKFPKLDKIKQDVRDEIFASEDDINDFLQTLSENVAYFTHEITNRNEEIKKSSTLLKESDDYYQIRKDEILNDEIPEMNEKVESVEDRYRELLKQYKEKIKSEFPSVGGTLSYESVSLGNIKNKIEKYKTLGDKELQPITPTQVTNAWWLPEFHRLNPDNRSSTIFFHQVNIPFNENPQEVELFTIKPMPAYWRTSSLENSTLGAFFINLKLRGKDLSADIEIFPQKMREGIKYGVEFFSEGSVNNGNLIKLKAYHNETTKEIKITILTPSKKIETQKDVFTDDNFLLNVGIQSLLSEDIIIPSYNDKTEIDKTNLKIVGEAKIDTDEYLYGPLDENTNDMEWLKGMTFSKDFSRVHNDLIRKEGNDKYQVMLSEDERRGKTSIYRIHTIESDIDRVEGNLEKSVYTVGGLKTNGGTKRVIDEFSELLLRSLQDIGLIAGRVYKAMGWVMITNVCYQVSQIKITKEKLVYPDRKWEYLDPSRNICGAEILFDPEQEFEYDDSTSNGKITNLKITTNGFSEVMGFPGLSLEGDIMLNASNVVSRNSDLGQNYWVNTRTAMKFSDFYNNKLTIGKRPYNLATALGNNVAFLQDSIGARICGYDISIFIPEDLKSSEGAIPTLEATNYEV